MAPITCETIGRFGSSRHLILIEASTPLASTMLGLFLQAPHRGAFARSRRDNPSQTRRER